MSPAGAPTIVVVGSLNLDIVVPVPHHPAPGETVLGGDHFRNSGGKGANQAVAAARLGAEVAMVGRVGDDGAGDVLLAALEDQRVDVSRVHRTPRAPSGIALIAVDERGENAIVVSPGANARVTPGDVFDAEPALRAANVVVLQLEIPMESVAAAASAAKGTVILNPAPARRLPAELLESVDILVPNRVELGVVLGVDAPGSLDEVARFARETTGPEAVVVTLGKDGALFVKGKSHGHIPAFEVDPVDTTAAGDSFCGALAEAVARGRTLEDAIRWGSAAAALTTTRRGAQRALPTRAEVERLLADR